MLLSIRSYRLGTTSDYNQSGYEATGRSDISKLSGLFEIIENDDVIFNVAMIN